MEEEKKEEKSLEEKVREEVEKKIKTIVEEQKIQSGNIDYLAKLVDIIKDLDNQKYWKIKEEKYMRYGNYDEYDNYGRRGRDSRGRYTESYGRRGVPGSGRGRYGGEEMLDDIYSAYGDYMESGEYGTYGTGESMQKIEIMADSLMDFIHHLKKNQRLS